MDLFAGIPVTDKAAAVEWYERLFGRPPSFLPNEAEAVWEVGDHRYVFVEVRPAHAGHVRHLLFVEDFEALVGQIAKRGLEPIERETLSNGVRKASYRDPDGNRFELGGS
ncbi:MAG TPA: VOC family protein [Candidatus Dormibacteraeota bacterium]|nr:VOC family protein [Candidatus Dormibacteraeota bacterium]